MDMTDPKNPVLPLPSSEPENPPPATPEEKQQHLFSSLDDVIEHCIGDFGWRQLLQAILVSFAWFFDAHQSFISVFTDAEPKWKCNANFTSCTPHSNICHLPSNAWSWDSPKTTSVISEWSLQCSGSFITGLPTSSFFLGCFIGGFALATLGDSSLGRKNLLVLSSFVMSVSGILTALSINIWMYSALRFISGFGRSVIGTCALVLSTELVGKKWRGNIGIMGIIIFTTGFLSLPGFAFFLEGSSWRLVYLWTCVPCIFYSCILYFFARESPRWLFVRGRKDEFAKTLRSLASPTTRTGMSSKNFFSNIHWEEKQAMQKSNTDIFSTMKVFLKKGWALRRLAAVMVAGLGVGTVYYGMPLGLGNLSFNLYLSVTLNAMVEFPASLLNIFLIGKLHRKRSVLGLAILSGACSIACVFVRWKGMQMGLELFSFFCACTAFDIILIYTLELFPTCVRNSAVATVRQSLVFGAVVSPMLVAAGRRKGLMLSYGVFGVTVLVCGLFVVFLPETRGRILSDTMEEEELKVRAAKDGA